MNEEKYLMCERVIGDEPCFWDVEGGYWCEVCGLKEHIRIQQERLNQVELAEVKERMESERLREALDDAAGYIAIGESAKANDFICRALGVDINHYGIYGEGEEE